MDFKDFENSPASFIAQRSSLNQLVAWHLYAALYFLEIKFGTYLKQDNKETDSGRKEQGQCL